MDFGCGGAEIKIIRIEVTQQSKKAFKVLKFKETVPLSSNDVELQEWYFICARSVMER